MVNNLMANFWDQYNSIYHNLPQSKPMETEIPKVKLFFKIIFSLEILLFNAL